MIQFTTNNRKKMMAFLRMTLVLVAILLQGCRQNVGEQPTQDVVDNEPTVQQGNTPREPDPSETPETFHKLGLHGEIWIIHNGEENYFEVFDLDTGVISRKGFPSECNASVATVKFLICKDSSMYIYLFFPASNEKVELNIRDPLTISVSPAGRYLLYGFELDSEQIMITVFDTDDNESRSILISVETAKDEYIFSSPTISFDGNYLIVGKANPETGFYLELVHLDSNAKTIFPIQNLTDGDTNWSPRENLLIYGEIEGPTDIPEGATQIFLMDTETSKSRFLASSPNFTYRSFSYNSPIWSPKGEQIALSREDALCIISIPKENQQCFSYPEQFGVKRAPLWSPYGNYILYSDSHLKRLMIFDVEEEKYKVLFENVDIFYYMWK